MAHRVKLIAALLSVCIVGGCCLPYQETQPSRPNKVRGWESYKVHTVKILGEFILNEGEATESETIGIQVLKISPLTNCLGILSEPPRKEVTLKIYRTADKSVLCETTVREGISILQCPKGHELPTVFVNGINTSERWVWFGLSETFVE